MVRRRARTADIDSPHLHAFRRAFAISMLRKGVDIFTLAKLMSHESIDVLKYYLKQTTEDIELAHKRFGPVDNWTGKQTKKNKFYPPSLVNFADLFVFPIRRHA